MLLPRLSAAAQLSRYAAGLSVSLCFEVNGEAIADRPKSTLMGNSKVGIRFA